MGRREEVPLREYVEALLEQQDHRYQQRFEAQTKAIDAALLAAEKAVTKAETATERRFESVNEFRATLGDQAAKLATRLELDAANERVRELAARVERMEGQALGSGVTRGAMSDTVKVLLTAGMLIMAVIGAWIAAGGFA